MSAKDASNASVSESPGGVWPHVRAALVSLHLLAIVIMATPSLGGAMSRKAWQQETVQSEFSAWSGRLNGLGFDTTPAGLEDWAWGVATKWTEIRKSLNEPLSPYHEYVGVRQRWRMFAAPHRVPARLEIEMQKGGQWHKVYVQGSDRYNWRSHQLAHERMRAAIFKYQWPQNRKTLGYLHEWIAARAEEDYPDADAVRMRFVRYRTPSPEDVRAGKEPATKLEAQFERRFDRSAAAIRASRAAPDARSGEVQP